MVEAGHIPIVEFGFTPRAFVPPDAGDRFAFEPGSPTQYSECEAGWWSFPPKDLARWEELVRATVDHCAKRYGRARVGEWRWEVWNEPDIGYWRGSVEEYLALYRRTVEAARSVLPGARVGGPATTGDLVPLANLQAEGPAYLGRFLDFCVTNSVPLDFVSFHTKGAYFQPWRGYLPPGERSEPQSPSMVKMPREVGGALRQVAAFPSLEVNDTSTLLDLVEAGLGVAVIPEAIARLRPALQQVTITDGSWNWTIAAQAVAPAPVNPAARALWAMLRAEGEPA
jgi:xylan 1,4-beta-xylosidase